MVLYQIEANRKDTGNDKGKTKFVEYFIKIKILMKPDRNFWTKRSRIKLKNMMKIMSREI